MSTKSLEFWYEFASTYSYLSVMRITTLAKEAEVEVIWKPFLLGPIFHQMGMNDSPFNIYPSKGRYMWKDLERQCQKHGLPFQKPSVFPRSGLLAARVALIGFSEDWGAEFTQRTFQSHFAEDREISDPMAIAKVLQDMGQNSLQILEQAQSQSIKDQLKTQTEMAMKHGLFGAPSFRVGEELFWGNDRLEDALAFAQ